MSRLKSQTCCRFFSALLVLMRWVLLLQLVACNGVAAGTSITKSRASPSTISERRSATIPGAHHSSPRMEAERRRRQHQQQQVRSLQQQEQQEYDSKSSQLRKDLLSGYDRGSFPWEYVWNASVTNNTDDADNTKVLRQGVPIELGINFHKIFQVDVTMSVVDLIVWVRERWQDPRLTWDPSEYDDLERTWFWIGDGSGSGGETSEIWTPDLELWNLESSLSESLTDTNAAVTSDGTVTWTRPGHLKAVCKFDGLDLFPYDTLKCTMEIGSWSFSGLYIRPIKFDGTGFTIGGSETAGEAYAEYSLLDVYTEEHTYPPYPIAPEEDWPVLFYHVTFQRAYQPYARGYVVLQVLLNFAAFACFWLPPHCGERMGLAITSLLAAVASELVISANLPQASEITWFAKFSIGSLMFASIALFESAVVIYFYHYSGDDLIPSYVKWWMELRKKEQKQLDEDKKREDRNGLSSQQTKPETDTMMDQMEPTVRTGNTRTPRISFASNLEEDRRREVARDVSETMAEQRENRLPAVGVSFMNDNNESDAEHSWSDSPSNGHWQQQHHHQQEEEESSRQLPPQRSSALTDLSLSSLLVTDQIKAAVGRDVDDFKNAEEVANNIYWKKVAGYIDEGSRVILPAAFALFLAILFGQKTNG